MKWVILIISVGIFRGIIFPDYGFSPNIFIIPFGMPLLIVILITYLSTTKRLNWVSSSLWGLFSIYISTLIGVLIYGYTNGWGYIIDDTESQAVFYGNSWNSNSYFFNKPCYCYTYCKAL